MDTEFYKVPASFSGESVNKAPVGFAAVQAAKQKSIGQDRISTAASERSSA